MLTVVLHSIQKTIKFIKKKCLEMLLKYCNTASSPQGKREGIPNNWISDS